MRYRRRLFALLLFVSTYAFASEDVSPFALIPPPVGTSDFIQGQRTAGAGVDAAYFNMEAFGNQLSMLGAMAYGNYQFCPSGSVALNGIVGVSGFGGTNYRAMAFQLPIELTAAYEPARWQGGSIFLIGGGGASFGLMSMNVYVPYLLDSSHILMDGTYVLMPSLVGNAIVGLQANLFAGSFVVSPFALYCCTGGVYSLRQTSAASYDYPSRSGTVDLQGSPVFGLDVFWKPWGVSLNSMFQITDSYTMFTLSLKRLLYTR